MVIDGDNPKFVMTIIDKEKYFQQILIAKREILLNELNLGLKCKNRSFEKIKTH